MKVIIVKSQEEGGKVAFEILEKAVTSGAKTLGLATGSSPITLYQEMVRSDLDFTDVTTINLDEYVGLEDDNTQSYHYFMMDNLFQFRDFKDTNVPNGKASDLEEECRRYDQIIEENPIDLQVLGVGPNGHIGFNEPGTPADATTHIADLTPSTIEANQRFFNAKEDVPTKAITMGIKSIMDSKEVIMLAYGDKKADAVHDMIEGEVSVDSPASVLQHHPNVTVIIDEAAASKLEKTYE